MSPEGFRHILHMADQCAVEAAMRSADTEDPIVLIESVYMAGLEMGVRFCLAHPERADELARWLDDAIASVPGHQPLELHERQVANDVAMLAER